MPVATAALADVVVGDDHPVMALRVGDHPLQKGALFLFGVGARGQLALRVAKPLGKRITDALEIPDGQHPRAADSADPPLDAGARKARGKQLAEATLEHSDLAA